MRKIFILTAAFLITALLMQGCGDKSQDIPSAPPSDAPDAAHGALPSVTPSAITSKAPPSSGVENFPAIDGSTATIPLGSALISGFTGKPREETDGMIVFSGTRNSYINLLEHRCALIIAYEPPQEVHDYITDMNEGAALDDVIEMAPIGRDALVFLINKNNPAQNLTTSQIQGIYSGEITNWSQVGGIDTPIKAFQRNSSSGSQTLMQKLVMKDIEMSKAPVEYMIGEMGALVDTIAEYNNSEYALGYNVYYYVTQMKNNSLIKILSVDGVTPDSDSIRNNEYPFVNDFYAAIRKDEPEDSPARRLYNWLLSEEGKALIQSEGYVPTP